MQSSVNAVAGQDLPIAWQNGGGGDVVVQLAAGTTARSAIAHCAFSAATGQGSVPASVIAAVGMIGTQTSITISTESRVKKAPDGWDLTVSLQSYGIRTGTYAGIASGLLKIH
jgi:hypothetical protein